MPSRASWRAVLLWFCGSRLIIAAIVVIGVATFLNQRQPGEVLGLASLNPQTVWLKWDVEWYQQIALHGYAWRLDDVKGQAAAAFFPLYPLTIGLLLRAMPFVSFFWLATMVSNLLALTALAIAVEHLTTGAEQVKRFLLVMVTSAGSFYLSIPYTESLFLLLVVSVMILTRRHKWFWAAALAGLAATTRVHGLALIAVPVITCRLDSTAPLPTRFTRIAIMLLLFAVPVAVYLWYQGVVQGSAEAFVIRQGMWDNALPYPFKAVVGLLQFPGRLSGWMHGAFWATWVALLVRYWNRMPLGEALFSAGALVISTQQESFHGVYRYVTPLVPLALALANDDTEWRQPIVIANIIFAVIMILAFVTWNRLAV